MSQVLEKFTVRQVKNGWIVTVLGSPECISPEFVFPTLVELAEWLKVQIPKEPQVNA